MVTWVLKLKSILALQWSKKFSTSGKLHVKDQTIHWEPEGHYRSSMMFCWEPEERYHCTIGDTVQVISNASGYLVRIELLTNWPIEKALHEIGYNQIWTK